jgi:pyruvate/2-oxoglutarate dehydrogenase complex dihydrolipoamide acyltransferase (E2) component
MSEYVFKLPDLGEGTVESEIGEWFIKVGDQVNEEDIVGTMMTDKAAVELSSPISGKVVKLAGEPGDIIAVGAALVVFDVAGDVPGDGQPAEPAAAPEPEAAQAPVVPEPVAAAAPLVHEGRVMTSRDTKRFRGLPGWYTGARCSSSRADGRTTGIERNQGHRPAAHHRRAHGDRDSRDSTFYVC